MKIAILTNFQDFVEGYSLTGIVLDQCIMLEKYGHDVHLYVSTAFNSTNLPEFIKTQITIHPKIKNTHLVDYKIKSAVSTEHIQISESVALFLIEELKDFDVVFSHDFIFTGWNLPYAMALMKVTMVLTQVRFLSWIHSIPSAMFDWWNVKLYGRNHKIVYPNNTDRLRVAEQYRGKVSDVRVIPHIKDLRTWFDFDKNTCELIDKYPKIMNADIVQIYPASVDRLSSKRVREVMLIFSQLKRRGKSVCLVIANQWATGTQQKQDIEHYKKIASRNGLITETAMSKHAKDIEVIFTSDFKAEYEIGISKRMIRELFQCSNLFIFPTREESFGLVIPEAAHAGVFMLLNKSLDMLIEVSGLTSLYCDFGSFHREFKIDNENEYFGAIAQIILGRLQESESLKLKTFARQKYNMDYLYNTYYGPIMNEADIWTT